MRKDDAPIIVEQTFNATIDTVWNSITKIDLMRQWYFDNIPAFRPEVGFETQFNVSSGDRNFLHVWRVTKVVPLQVIAYSWKFADYPGDALVVFELSKQDNLTDLKLSCIVREDFPEGIPEFTRESCIGGWEFFIKKRLKEYLEKTL
ncbi:MAG: SRPBCC domain-containing protein [candidate division Zixibacteria bacterium]|nr:SRPBCC domain-containing protein [candidate division Zixibacteria bacterium]